MFNGRGSKAWASSAYLGQSAYSSSAASIPSIFQASGFLGGVLSEYTFDHDCDDRRNLAGRSRLLLEVVLASKPVP